MTFIPMARAMVCLNDDAVFDLADGVMSCPSCGGEFFQPLQVWLGSAKEGGRQTVSGAVTTHGTLTVEPPR